MLDGITTILRNFPNFRAVCVGGKAAGKSISLFQKYWPNACGCQRGEERKHAHCCLQIVSLPEPLAVHQTPSTPLGEAARQCGSPAERLGSEQPLPQAPGLPAPSCAEHHTATLPGMLPLENIRTGRRAVPSKAGPHKGCPHKAVPIRLSPQGCPPAGLSP